MQCVQTFYRCSVSSELLKVPACSWGQVVLLCLVVSVDYDYNCIIIFVFILCFHENLSSFWLHLIFCRLFLLF